MPALTCRRRRTAVALAAVCVFGAGSEPAAARAWRWPIRGTVIGRFAFAPDRPYAAGQRRGIDVAGRAGATVRAVCTGRVSFVGALPSAGRGVTERCGSWAVTYLGLSQAWVARGTRVGTGVALGSLGSTGELRLGVRRVGDRFGYRDPLELLGAPALAPPAVGPAPGRPATPTLLRRRRTPAIRGVAPAVPSLAWVGVLLAAGALPVGGLAWRRRRRPAPALRPVVDERG